MGLTELLREKRQEILTIAAKHGAYNVRSSARWPGARRMRPAMWIF